LAITLKVPVKNPWAGLRGLPRTVWIVAATSLVNRAGMMALPFLVLYLTGHLGTSASLAGLAVSAYGLGVSVTGPIAGRLCDRFGPFTVMRASLVLTGVVLLVIPLAHRFAAVAVLTFVWGIVADSTRPATMSALTNATPAERRKAAIALNRLAVNLGMSIGPAIGGFLALVSFSVGGHRGPRPVWRRGDMGRCVRLRIDRGSGHRHDRRARRLGHAPRGRR